MYGASRRSAKSRVADRRVAGREGNASGGPPSMNDHGKSDGPVLPAKPPNNTGSPVAEVVEERGLPEGNAASKTRPGHSAGQGAPSALDRVREVAVRDKDARFTALLHHVDVDRLRAAYRALRPRAAPGVDGVTWVDYGRDLEGNLRDLNARVHRGSYRARPVRRRAGRGTKPEARLVANPQRGIRAGGGQSRRLVAATPELSGSDGWSAWSATVQEQPYSLVRSITMSRPDSAVHNS
jgi:hypothetical protein